MWGLIAMFILGFILGCCVCVLFYLSCMDDCMTDDEIADMCEWYELNYGKDEENAER